MSKKPMNNDLISREALKNEFRAICRCAETVEELANTMEDAIDNASPVETSKIEYKAYYEGFKDGVEQGIRLSDRPQGKWIKIFENPFTNGYVCPFCGHKIQVTEQFLPQVTECESCGADMKGGAK